MHFSALKLAQNLAKKAKCILIHSNYSRLLCDVNRPVTSGTLFRKEGDGKEILLNKEITLKEEKYRLDNFYYSYYAAFREIALKTKPKILISLHSFNPIYEGVERDVEIGILSSFSDDLSLIVCFIFRDILFFIKFMFEKRLKMNLL